MTNDDPLNRDRFYSVEDAEPKVVNQDDQEADDSAEYEVEPVDEHVAEQARLRAVQALREAESAIDINAIYHEMKEPVQWLPSLGSLRLRFGVKHLLITVTCAAIVLGMLRGGLLGGRAIAILIALVFVAILIVNVWVSWLENRQERRAIRRREHALAVARGEEVEPLDDDGEDSFESNLAEFYEDVRSGVKSARFSTADLLGGLGVAALLMLLPNFMGVANAWSLIGLLMVIGIAGAVTSLFSPPRVVMVGWGLAVIGYLLLSLAVLLAKSLGFI
ncbi:hypothetical protein [Botrimarina hoheduenensis]|uniref:Uncharacterized protein n=1 Tax=Botrimarina hoheduenensis TaxID=2528000 RepID=A0A5C5VWT5_9BACT|nr:hypothetical protein [Botrimarina hoheduenensis]TWT42475.1 hypothetical protein Pla111_27800 [Botrimarina hoheduenensis]